MIKFPKEIDNLMEKIEANDFNIYAAGSCVRESLLNQSPLDWDLFTDAGLDDINRILDEGSILNKEKGVYRIEFPYREDEDDGIIADIFSLNGKTIEEKLTEYEFTCDAIAVKKDHKAIDIFKGSDDIKRKLLKLVNEDEAFEKNPLLVLQIVRMSAQTGLDMPKALFDKILLKKDILRIVEIEKIRDEFILLIDSLYAGKGLRLLSSLDMLGYIVGEKNAKHMSKKEKKEYDELCQGIDKIKFVTERRLGCFYLCFDGKRCDDAVKRMKYDNRTETFLLDTIYQMPVMFFIKTKADLKNFIADFGIERYEYLHNLSKAQRIIWGGREDKIVLRTHLLNEIKEREEILFEEDLPVTREELIEKGLATEENIDKIMRSLLDAAFQTGKASHDALIKRAEKLSTKRNRRWARK